jgi:hypothetical protein
LKDREYIGNSGRGKAGTGFMEECHMLGADTCVTIKTLIEENFAMGAAWHVGAEGLELETMILSCNFWWVVNEMLLSNGGFLSRD